MALCLPSTTALTQAEIAQATTLAELTDQQLIEFSSAICYGTITDMNSIQTDAGFIVTAVDIDVIRWLKPEQNSSKTYTFYIRGGEYGDIVQNVHGEPSLRVGQSIVAFLEDVPRYRLPMLLGLGQGAFIQTDDPQIQPPSKRSYEPRIVHQNQSTISDANCRNDANLPSKRAIRSAKSDFDTAKTTAELLEKIEVALAHNASDRNDIDGNSGSPKNNDKDNTIDDKAAPKNDDKIIDDKKIDDKTAPKNDDNTIDDNTIDDKKIDDKAAPKIDDKKNDDKKNDDKKNDDKKNDDDIDDIAAHRPGR